MKLPVLFYCQYFVLPGLPPAFFLSPFLFCFCLLFYNNFTLYNKNKCVANGSPATHLTVRQQGGSGEESHVRLADWTLSVAALEKKKCYTTIHCDTIQTISLVLLGLVQLQAKITL